MGNQHYHPPLRDAIISTRSIWSSKKISDELALVASTPRPQVIYVGKHGDDSNTGQTPDAAKLTITAALSALSGYDDVNKGLVIVMDGAEYDEQIVIPSNVDMDARFAKITTFGDVNWAVSVTDNSVVLLGRMHVGDDDSGIGGVQMLGGAGTRCKVHVEEVTTTTDAPMFQNLNAGFLECSVGDIAITGNQGVGFKQENGSGTCGMQVSWRTATLGGNAVLVQLLEGLISDIDGGIIVGTATDTGIELGDVKVSGYVSTIDIPSGTAYSTTGATSGGLAIGSIKAGNIVEAAFVEGIIQLDQAPLGTRNPFFSIGRGNAGLFEAKISTNLLTGNEDYEMPEGGGTFLTNHVVSKAFGDSPYSAVLNDVILCNAVGGNMVINLPAAASSSNGQINIKKVDASANTITIDGNGAETIDGATTAVLTTQWENITIVCDGSAWFII